MQNSLMKILAFVFKRSNEFDNALEQTLLRQGFGASVNEMLLNCRLVHRSPKGEGECPGADLNCYGISPTSPSIL